MNLIINLKCWIRDLHIVKIIEIGLFIYSDNKSLRILVNFDLLWFSYMTDRVTPLEIVKFNFYAANWELILSLFSSLIDQNQEFVHFTNNLLHLSAFPGAVKYLNIMVIGYRNRLAVYSESHESIASQSN